MPGTLLNNLPGQTAAVNRHLCVIGLFTFSLSFHPDYCLKGGVPFAIFRHAAHLDPFGLNTPEREFNPGGSATDVRG